MHHLAIALIIASIAGCTAAMDYHATKERIACIQAGGEPQRAGLTPCVMPKRSAP